MRRTLAFIPLIGLALVAGCSAPAPAEERETFTPSPSASAEATPTPTPEAAEPDGSRGAPFPYGTVFHVADDSIWDFTIHSPQADANSWVAASDDYNPVPSPENTWVGANLAVTVRDIPEASAQTEPTTLSFSLEPVYVGASGTIYDFWTVDGPALFDGSSWNSLPDVFITPGQQWDQPFALQVPVTDVEGGSFAVRHGVTGKVIFFGE